MGISSNRLILGIHNYECLAKMYESVDLLSAMRARVPSDNLLVDQLVAIEVANSSSFGAALRVEAYIGGVHRLVSVPV